MINTDIVYQNGPWNPTPRDVAARRSFIYRAQNGTPNLGKQIIKVPLHSYNAPIIGRIPPSKFATASVSSRNLYDPRIKRAQPGRKNLEIGNTIPLEKSANYADLQMYQYNDEEDNILDPVAYGTLAYEDTDTSSGSPSNRSNVSHPSNPFIATIKSEPIKREKGKEIDTSALDVVGSMKKTNEEFSAYLDNIGKKYTPSSSDGATPKTPITSRLTSWIESMSPFSASTAPSREAVNAKPIPGKKTVRTSPPKKKKGRLEPSSASPAETRARARAKAQKTPSKSVQQQIVNTPESLTSHAKRMGSKKY